MAAVEDAEQWFVAHGLPYFVDGLRAEVRARLSRGRLAGVLLVALAVGVLAGIAVGLWSGYASIGIGTAATVVLVILAAYAIRALKTWLIVTWAIGRTFRSLGLLFPLATRALPLLLLFITFLFINAEVWQVASSLEGGVLWLAVLLFAAVAVGFLLVRLGEELDRFDDDIDGAQLIDACRRTPLEDVARDLVEAGADLNAEAEVSGLQKANLVLVLLIAQIVQVLLLSLAVFMFFLVFGMVAIEDSTILAWTGAEPQYASDLRLVSRELTQVSIFLAAFAGLYFTVYAVTDTTYRQQFFTTISRELERAVSARVAYRELRRRQAG
jgi:hypothetical protein